MTNPYVFTDNPMVSGVSVCNTDIVNDNIMSLKWMHDHISFRNIGEIVTSTIPLTDAGLHLLDGALISGSGIYADFVDYIAGLVTDYPDLFETEANWQSAVTTYGVCGKFVYNSVNNTVRLPKYSNKIYTKDVNNVAPVVGNGKALGFTTGSGNYCVLRRFTSSDGNYINYPYAQTSSALNIGDNVDGSYPTDRSGLAYGITTDATKSGIIADLSNITTSLDGYYYIVVATITKTDIQVDIDEIATDLNGKADVDLTNTNNQAKILMSSMGMPSSTYETLTVGSAGTTYTAPSNGYYVIIGTPPNTNTGGYVMLTNVTGKVQMASTNIWTRTMAAYIAVRKGDTVRINYSDSSDTALTFIYAQGSESEAS